MPIISEWEHHAKCGGLNFIGDHYRCGLINGEIWGFSKLEDMYYNLSLMSNHES
jgi:hypothetical protein